MVNLHFLSLMEALLECRSTILAKLMPLWCPVLHAYNTTVMSQTQINNRHNLLGCSPVISIVAGFLFF